MATFVRRVSWKALLRLAVAKLFLLGSRKFNLWQRLLHFYLLFIVVAVGLCHVVKLVRIILDSLRRFV